MLSVTSLDRRLHTAALCLQQEMWDQVLALLAGDLGTMDSLVIDIDEDEVLENLHYGRS